MELIADYHVHSKFSKFLHGKDSIQELVNAANSLGLQEIAITDHGFRHLFGTNKKNLAKARELVDEINQTSPVKVLLGIEADIISEDGTLDVDNETLAMIDILIAGYHKMIKTDFAGYFGSKDDSPDAIQRNTNAYLNAIKKYPITIIAHLNYGVKVDVRQIANACANENICIEINNRHLYFSDDEAQALIDSDCMLIVDSDAHSRDEIAKVDKAFDFIKKHDFKSENFVNIKFDLSEMSEEHKEMDAYYSIYQDKLNKKREVELYNEERRQNEFTNTLSDDLEKQLKDIAEERGYRYTHNTVADDTFNINMDYGENYEAEELIARAEKYIAENKGKEPAKAESQEKSTETPQQEETNEALPSVESHEGNEQVSNGVSADGTAAAEQQTAEQLEKTGEQVEDNGTPVTKENVSENSSIETQAKAVEKAETEKPSEQLNGNEVPEAAKNTETLEKPSETPPKVPGNTKNNARNDDGFRFNLGMIDAKATRSTNKGTKIQKFEKNNQNSKPNNKKKNGKVLV